MALKLLGSLESSGGNVGIGTTSPVSTLHIKTSVDNSVAQGLVIERSTNSDRGYINYNGGGFQFRSTVGDPIVFGETDAEHMRILPDGNVGIGTASPYTKLVVGSRGTAAATSILAYDGIAFDFYNDGSPYKRHGVIISQAADASESVLDFNTKAASGTNSTKMTILGNGNVGIGTTSPGNRLRIDAAAGQATTLANSITNAAVYINSDTGNGSNNIRIGESGNGSYFLQVSNSAGTSPYAINLNPFGGNVGIGTTTPDAPLHVAPAAGSYKVIKLGDDTVSHYKLTGQADHTLTLTCGSYYMAEVVITASQSNSGGYNNLYIRGIWSNNHTTHHWDVLEEVGYMTSNSISITNTENDVSNSGKLEIVHDYGASFMGMTVRVTDYNGTHSYTIS